MYNIMRNDGNVKIKAEASFIILLLILLCILLKI